MAQNSQNILTEGASHSTKLNMTRWLTVVLAWFPSVLFAASWYVDNAATGNNKGMNWANAWVDFASISWGDAGVRAGDTLYISGGLSGKVYRSALLVGAAGASNAPITIMVGQEVGHNGLVTLSNQVIVKYDWVTINGGKNPKAAWPKGLPFTPNNLLALLNTNIGLVVKCSQGPLILMEALNGNKCKWVRAEHSNTHGIQHSHSSRSGSVVTDAEISYCLVRSNAHDGINFVSNAGTNWQSLLVSYCVSHDNGDDNVQVADCTTIHHCWLAGRLKGSKVGHPDTIQAVGDYFSLHHNYISGEWNSWVFFEFGYSSVGPSDVGNWRIYNNVFCTGGKWHSSGYGVSIGTQMNGGESKAEFIMPAKNGGTVEAKVWNAKLVPGVHMRFFASGKGGSTNFAVMELVSKKNRYDVVLKNLETTEGAYAENIEPGTRMPTRWICGATTNSVACMTVLDDIKIPNIHIVNNTFVNGPQSSLLLCIGNPAHVRNVGLTNALIKNNLFYDAGSRVATAAVLLNDRNFTLKYTTNECVFDYNVVAGRSKRVRYGQRNYEDVMALNADTGFAHNTAKAPLFADYLNWDVSLSGQDTVARDAGQDLSTLGLSDLEYDITGVKRTGAWDIGAYEYVPEREPALR